MLKNFVKIFGGDPNKKTIEQYSGIAEQINALEPQFEALNDDALRAKTDEFRKRIAESIGNVEGLDVKEQFKAQQEELNEILPEAFAAVREASKRTIGLRHFDVQMIGGVALHRGSIAEMRTGEGKTLVATLPVYLNALVKRGVHLITVNDYLASRDARWMAPIYHMLGLTVGVLQMAAVTENGKKAFLVDFECKSPNEDQNHLRMVDRRLAYEADVTFGTNAEFGFDYLRDNLTPHLDERVQRGHHYAIIDEVDNVLIDEARTPLIISGPASGDLGFYERMAQVVKQLRREDYELNEKDRNVTITEVGLAHVEQIIGQPLMDPVHPEEVTPEQARLRGHLEQALRAQFVFKRDKDYLVHGGKVVIVDEFTGRQMPGRRWSDGLHQAVEAKEGVKIEPENVTSATITLQNYFRMYKKLAGMTGTALTEAEEFSKIYNLEVTPIPSNLEYQASGKNPGLIEVKSKDKDGYPFSYFEEPVGAETVAKRKQKRFFRRKDYPDVIYKTVEAKLRAITMEIVREHVRGRPLLIGTTSVESSELLSKRLGIEALRRLIQVAFVRRVWMEANNREEDGRLIPELQPLNEPLEKVTPDLLRELTKPFGVININPEDPSNLHIILQILELEEADLDRLKRILQPKGGVPHQVLNARKHTEESKIIARAGALGAVTIATNMAGRGVDIKLGGEFDPTDLAGIKKILLEDVPDVYTLTEIEIFNSLLLTLGKRLKINDVEDIISKRVLEYPKILRQVFIESAQLSEAVLQSKTLKEWDLLSYALRRVGILEKLFDKIQSFWTHSEQEITVRALGGLHVIGSERHEARRIDNQLRGRAARQGDPGSSRFYLSLQDDLMRLQGGSQVSSLMERLRVDDSLPIEARMVGNIIEQSQHRIEGTNFDVRKHLLEYDDVLNQQRIQIYDQRDQILAKGDLFDDANEMLYAEANSQVESLFEEFDKQEVKGKEDEEWLQYGRIFSLLGWLDQTQPAFCSEENNPRYRFNQWAIRYHKTQRVSGRFFPSFSFKLLIDRILSCPELKNFDRQRHTSASYLSDKDPGLYLDPQLLRIVLIQIAGAAIDSEEQHFLRALKREFTDAEETIETRVTEKVEEVEAFLEGLRNEEDMNLKKWSERMQYLTVMLGVPPEQVKLPSKPTELGDDFLNAIRERVSKYYFHRFVTNTIGFLKRHMGSEDNVVINSLVHQSEPQNLDELESQIETIIAAVFAQRRKHYLGDDNDGFIFHQLDESLQHYRELYSLMDGERRTSLQENLSAGVPVTFLVNLLLQMSITKVNVYQMRDASGRIIQDTVQVKGQTKRVVRQLYSSQYHLNYVYLIADILKEMIYDGTKREIEEELKELILDHLESAQQEQIFLWGAFEIQKQATSRIENLDLQIREKIQETLGVDRYEKVAEIQLKNLEDVDRPKIRFAIGQYVLSEAYRDLMVATITSKWVDYLTQIEALRISINLEAYAQRDPLVQFKTQATDKFGILLDSIRSGVAEYLFVYQPKPGINLTEQVEEAEDDTELISDEDTQLPMETVEVANGKTQSKVGRRRRKKNH